MAWRYACGFFQNPEIIFYHFFCIFNLDIFLVLILQKRIGSRDLDPVTPTTVLSRSFETLSNCMKLKMYLVSDNLHLSFENEFQE